MKKIILTAVVGILALTCTIIFAQSETSTSSSVTNTSSSGTNSHDNNTTESTTYTTTTTNTKTSKDDDIVSAIYSKYAQESALDATSLTVSSQNGIVTVSGTVTAQSQADEAVIAAKSIPGVKDVRSSISVTTNPNANKPGKPAPNY